ncbi:hypothetical protein, partial [Micromonospora sp. CV4]|uniref:hypothetical protein n=1 Tax=Micromonospora sp. CV4 TaxID=2478711 RepID=UPI000F174E5B
FAARCATAAKTAYSAAKAHPAVYASPTDGTGGGGRRPAAVFFWLRFRADGVNDSQTPHQTRWIRRAR